MESTSATMASSNRRPNGADTTREIEQAQFNATTTLILADLKKDVEELRTLVVRGLIWGVGFLLTVIGVLAGALFKLKA